MDTRADRILQYVKGPYILDIGCVGHVAEPNSPYWVHEQLHQNFSHVIGIDINEKEIEKLRSLGYDGLHVASAETFTLPHKFDTIVAGELIEHLCNPGLFLERAKEHLTEGGRLVITTPYPFSLLYTLYALFKFPKTCQNPEHTCWFCPRTIGELARRSGFRIIKWGLIEDYRVGDPSPRYRFFVKFISLFGFLIPKRLRCNAMLFILERDADHPCS